MNKHACLLLSGIALLLGCGGGGGGGGTTNGAPPIPTVSSASSISSSGALLNGTVIPNGLQTQIWFEYGADPSLSIHSDTPQQSIGSGLGNVSTSVQINGLAGNSRYYFRVCASNSKGVAQSSITSFITLFADTCLGCHGGIDGNLPAVNGAPVVTRYWQTSGHGKAGIGLPLSCEDCHETGTPTGEHAGDGSGTFNTLSWPGKSDNTTNANTAHLKSFFFPASPGSDNDYAIVFDNACGNRVGCHATAGGGRNVSFMNHTRSSIMEFGKFGTPPDPKIYMWYSQYSYPDDFYKSQSPWLIGDLTTETAGALHYGTCISCHDPHGTGATDFKASGSSNAMVRGNFRTQSLEFCNIACHNQ